MKSKNKIKIKIRESKGKLVNVRSIAKEKKTGKEGAKTIEKS